MIRAADSAVFFIDLLLFRVVNRDRAENGLQFAVEPDRHFRRRLRDRPTNSRFRPDRKRMGKARRWRCANYDQEHPARNFAAPAQTLYLDVGPMTPQGVQVKTFGQISSINTWISPLTPTFFPETLFIGTWASRPSWTYFPAQ